MLIVRYLIALVFSIFMMATSLRIEARYKRQSGYKISTPNRLVLQMEEQRPGVAGSRDIRALDRRRLVI
ncbi:uncharacterized protein LOC115631340 [Scaptodrosophila lebanonensis]|uniref:Uncharacterized protein LOC115631340 n=1 Tax=Drosophila lebanonensis TaxID=7225 RepID=A0A6J2U9Q2_DROLE|nr:uncharacterized protein LOC115631340 [Scaptodrosophila lebanonensis]